MYLYCAYWYPKRTQVPRVARYSLKGLSRRVSFIFSKPMSNLYPITSTQTRNVQSTQPREGYWVNFQLKKRPAFLIIYCSLKEEFEEEIRKRIWLLIFGQETFFVAKCLTKFKNFPNFIFLRCYHLSTLFR